MNPLNAIQGTIVAGVVLAIVIALRHDGDPVQRAELHHVDPRARRHHLDRPALLLQLRASSGARGGRQGPGRPRRRGHQQVRRAARCCGSAGGPSSPGCRGAAYLAARRAVRPGVHAAAGRHSIIGIGAWLGTIMLFNVWVLIWPNQKKVLGLVEATADQIAKARRVAFLASRTNTDPVGADADEHGRLRSRRFLPLIAASIDRLEDPAKRELSGSSPFNRPREFERCRSPALPPDIATVVSRAIAEDLGGGDLTARADRDRHTPDRACRRARAATLAAAPGSRRFASSTRALP